MSDEAEAESRSIHSEIRATPDEMFRRSFDGGEKLLDFFAFEHLPPHLRAVSEPLRVLAHQMVRTLPRSAERTAGLRKLLEAKDCFVRAALP